MLEQLLRDLDSLRPSVRKRAREEACRLPPEDLMALLELEGKHYVRRKKAILRNVTLGLATTLALAIVVCRVAALDPVFMLFALLFLPYAALCYVPVFTPGRVRKGVLAVLESADDPRFVGPALVMLASHGPNSHVKWSVTRALQRLLPGFRADQAKMLTAKQKKALLVNLLEPYRYPRLSVCLLRALEQIGDAEALPVVQKIAGSRTRQAPDVVAAARECLPFLEIRVEQSRQAQTLLRPSDPGSACAPDTLLRPAENADRTPPEQLLRSTLPQ